MIRKMLRERARARAVAALAAVGAPAEPGFDRFVDQAAAAFAAPISLLTLIDDEQLWVRASTGLSVVCAPRQESFCTRGVDRGAAILEVCDAMADPDFRTLPVVVGDPHARYYIGAPLSLDSGVEVGMLCVLDTKPRLPASIDQRSYLRGLARQAAAALERNAQLRGAIAA